MQNSVSRELVSGQGLFLGDWGNLSKVQKSIQKRKWDRAALLLCLLPPMEVMLPFSRIQKKTNPTLVILAITATIKSTTHTQKGCRWGGIRDRPEQGAKLIIKQLQNPPKNLPFPKSERILMSEQSKANSKKCRSSMYSFISHRLWHTHTHSFSMTSPPAPRPRPAPDTQNSPTLGQ